MFSERIVELKEGLKFDGKVGSFCSKLLRVEKIGQNVFSKEEEYFGRENLLHSSSVLNSKLYVEDGNA